MEKVGSGIPDGKSWIRDPGWKKVRSGMKISDPEHYKKDPDSSRKSHPDPRSRTARRNSRKDPHGSDSVDPERVPAGDA